MENNDSTPKPQETGGLKLMTVFIGVLALHVVVIGGFTVYHLMSGGGTDADLVVDKNHKAVKVTPDSLATGENTAPDTSTGDKTTTVATTPADTTGTPVTIPAPPAEAATATVATTPTPNVPPPVVSPVHQPTASAPSGPIRSGPVVTPPNSTPQVASQSEEPAATDSDSGVSGKTTYTVKAHDSLAHIAKHNHVKMAALRAANGLKSDKLHLGQKLIIPEKTETAFASEPAVTPARHSSTEPDRTLLGDSPIFSKSSGTAHEKASVVSSGSSRHSYVVAKGDTLTKIAHKFHTSSSALMALNNISDARKLHPGQKLRIPSSESRSATSSPAQTRPDHIEPRATPSAQLANFIN